MRAVLLLLPVLACTEPQQPPFAMPKNLEDVRARLLTRVPEGREIGEARTWMGEHGFQCDPPHPWDGPDGKSPEDTAAVPGIAHVCHAKNETPADAGWRSWTIVLIERKNRFADVKAY